MLALLRSTRAVQRVAANGTVVAAVQRTRSVSKCRMCNDHDTSVIRNKLGLDSSFYTCACDEVQPRSQDSLVVLKDRYLGMHAILKPKPPTKTPVVVVNLLKGKAAKGR